MQQPHDESAPPLIELVRLDDDPGSVADPSPRPGLGWSVADTTLLLAVAIPMVLALIYVALLAADRYESQAQFVVRSPRSTIAGEITALVNGDSVARATVDAYIVESFVHSREAVSALLEQTDIVDMLGRPTYDVLWRYPSPFQAHSQDALRKYLEGMVSVDYNATAGVGTLKVQAFRPQDAQLIAKVLLARAEQLINRLGERGTGDALTLTRRAADEAHARALDVQRRVTEFRRRHSVIDPAGASQARQQTISQLLLQKAQASASLEQLNRTTQGSPQVQVLRNRIAALTSQIDAERQMLSQGSGPLIAVIAEYEALVLERTLAERSYGAALQAYELARIDSERHRLYLEHVSAPSLPQTPRYPWRLLNTLLIIMAAAAAYRLATFLHDTLRRRWTDRTGAHIEKGAPIGGSSRSAAPPMASEPPPTRVLPATLPLRLALPPALRPTKRAAAAPRV